MITKHKTMRLQDDDWNELERVGKLNRSDRTQLVRQIIAHVFPNIQTPDDLKKFLYGAEKK